MSLSEDDISESIGIYEKGLVRDVAADAAARLMAFYELVSRPLPKDHGTTTSGGTTSERLQH